MSSVMNFFAKRSAEKKDWKRKQEIILHILNYEAFKARNLEVKCSLGVAYFLVSEKKNDPNTLTNQQTQNDAHTNIVTTKQIDENNLEEPILQNEEDPGKKIVLDKKFDKKMYVIQGKKVKNQGVDVDTKIPNITIETIPTNEPKMYLKEYLNTDHSIGSRENDEDIQNKSQQSELDVSPRSSIGESLE